MEQNGSRARNDMGTAVRISMVIFVEGCLYYIAPSLVRDAAERVGKRPTL
jgi:uncharacterized protein YjeT (DUF2065 family)